MASIPDPPKRSLTERRRVRRNRWIAVSLLVHAAVIVYIIVLPPPIFRLDEMDERDVKLTQDEAERLQEQLEESLTPDLQEKLQELQRLQDMVDEQREQRLEQLEEFQEEFREDLPQELQDAADEVLESQREIVQKEETSQSEFDELDEMQEDLQEAVDRQDLDAARSLAQSIAEQTGAAKDPQMEGLKEAERTLEKIEKVSKLLQHYDIPDVTKEWQEVREMQEQADNALQKARNELGQQQGQSKGAAAAFGKNSDEWKESLGKTEEERSKKDKKALKQMENAVNNLAADRGNRELLEKALDAQKKALQKTEGVAAKIQDMSPADMESIEPTAEQPDRDPWEMDAAEAYDEAMDLEKNIAEIYREARAAELAMIQKIPPKQALEEVQAPVPEHQPVNADAITKGAKSTADIEALEEAVQQASLEMDKMVANAESMHNTLASSGTSVTGDFQMSGESIQDRIGRLRQLGDMSAETAGAQDLSALMKQIGQDGEEGPDSDGGTSEEGGFGVPGGTPGAGGPSQGVKPNFKGQHGRRIAEFGEPARWFYVDGWYIIGPFPNPGRKNINKEFPPERVINLDAVYTIGKGGRNVSWQWVSSPEPRVVPPVEEEYAIYYAYTELYCENARDAWIAVGSDDRSDMWINDFKVWTSSNQLKSWRINEGLKKVHFRQGYNKLLVRLENGWKAAQFSVLVSTFAE